MEGTKLENVNVKYCLSGKTIKITKHIHTHKKMFEISNQEKAKKKEKKFKVY